MRNWVSVISVDTKQRPDHNAIHTCNRTHCVVMCGGIVEGTLVQMSVVQDVVTLRTVVHVMLVQGTIVL
jgi:sulfite exporter TauE/SafE